MSEANRFLLDTNIIRGARSGNRTCDLILSQDHDFHLLVTEEVVDELGLDGVPDGISVIPARFPRRKAKSRRSGIGSYAQYDYINPEVRSSTLRTEGTKDYMDKEYGGLGGRRKDLSRADKSLVRAFAEDSTIKAVITEDKRDLEHGLYNYGPLDRKPLVLSAKEFAEKYMR